MPTKLFRYLGSSKNVSWPEGSIALLLTFALILIMAGNNRELLNPFRSGPLLAWLYACISLFGIIAQGLFSWRWHGINVDTSEIRESQGSLYLFFQNFLNISLSTLGWLCGYVLIFTRELIPADERVIILPLVGFIALLGMTGLMPKLLWEAAKKGSFLGK